LIVSCLQNKNKRFKKCCFIVNVSNPAERNLKKRAQVNGSASIEQHVLYTNVGKQLS
jgi:hypothetical protein